MDAWSVLSSLFNQEDMKLIIKTNIFIEAANIKDKFNLQPPFAHYREKLLLLHKMSSTTAHFQFIIAQTCHHCTLNSFLVQLSLLIRNGLPWALRHLLFRYSVLSMILRTHDSFLSGGFCHVRIYACVPKKL